MGEAEEKKEALEAAAARLLALGEEAEKKKEASARAFEEWQSEEDYNIDPLWMLHFVNSIKK